MPDTPIAPGDVRKTVVYNEDGYLAPVKPLKKGSPGSHVHELARISDLLGENRYRGVIWVANRETGLGEVLNLDGSQIGGYLFYPFSDLGEAYTAALVRFGVPTSENRVLIVSLSSFIETESPVNFSSKYIDFLGIGDTVIAPKIQGQDAITISSGGGHFFENFTLLSRNSGNTITQILEDPLEFRNLKVRSEVESGNPDLAHFTLENGLSLSQNAPLVFKDIDANLVRRALVKLSGGEMGGNTGGMQFYRGTIRKSEGSNPVFLGIGSMATRMDDIDITRASGTSNLILKAILGGSTHINTNQRFDFNRVRLIGDTSSLDFRMAEGYDAVLPTWKNVTSNSRVRLGTHNVSGGVVIQINMDECHFGGNFEVDANLKSLSSSRINNSSAALWRFTANSAAFQFVMRGCWETSTTTTLGTVLTTTVTSTARLYECRFNSRIHTGSGAFAGTVIGGYSRGIPAIGNTTGFAATIQRHNLIDPTTSKSSPPVFKIAGSGYSSPNYEPILISGVISEGMIDCDTKDWSSMPDRRVHISDSTFTIPNQGLSTPEEDRYLTAVFPGLENPDGKIQLTSVKSLLPSRIGELDAALNNSELKNRVQTNEGWIRGFLGIVGVDADLVQVDNPRALMEGAGMFSILLKFNEGEQSMDYYDIRIPETAAFTFTTHRSKGVTSQIHPVDVEVVPGSFELGLDVFHRVFRFTLREPVKGVPSLNVVATTILLGDRTTVMDVPTFSDSEKNLMLEKRGYQIPVAPE